MTTLKPKKSSHPTFQPHINSEQKIPAISMTIKKRGKSGYYISSVPMKTLSKLQQHSQRHTWQLSKDNKVLLLL